MDTGLVVTVQFVIQNYRPSILNKLHILQCVLSHLWLTQADELRNVTLNSNLT